MDITSSSLQLSPPKHEARRQPSVSAAPWQILQNRDADELECGYPDSLSLQESEKQTSAIKVDKAPPDPNSERPKENEFQCETKGKRTELESQ